MIDEVILNYVLLFIILEIYEISWQKAQTMMGMLARMYHQYSKSIILFLIMHPTFYFSIFFAMISEYNSYAIILVIIKTLDIAVKILLIDKIFIKKEFSEDLALALFAKINIFLPYIGLVIYPALILLAL